MKVCLPDLSGPPLWWDLVVLAVGVTGLVVLADRVVGRG